MTILFVILIIVAAFVLGLIVLIQNPKGGGLAGSFGGLNTQFMGVKQTNDVLEKGTWIFVSVIAALCLVSSFFMSGSAAVNTNSSTDRSGIPLPAQQQQATPPTQLPVNTTTIPDSPAK
ncbi:MAG: preprotein translocase subunit SecG [Chitinophagaceae bacterium]